MSRSTPLQRRIAWFAIACAAGSLAITTANRLSGGTVRWTAWALPLLLAANADVLFLGRLDRRPRLVRAFIVLSLVLAVAIIVSEVLVMLHR